MKVIKFIFRIIFGTIRFVVLAIGLVFLGISLIYLFPVALIGSIIFGILKCLDKILRFFGKSPKKKYVPEDTINESIKEDDSEDSSEEG